VAPIPSSTAVCPDYFGNGQTFFTLQEPHERLIVEANSYLEVHPVERSDFSASPRWESVPEWLAQDHSAEGLDAYQFVFDSQRAKARPELAEYARESFRAGRPLLEGALDLTGRINKDFIFDSKATAVSTSVETVFEKRRGVCQDFAHLQIAFMRSLGLPARYVSGYLRTMPPPGRPRLIGADASHAWCSAWSPGAGWVDFDPTNNCVPSDGHITVGWGRDYSDVSPIHGVLLGGAKHTLEVGVDVMPME
jgi:transglutaminase-like putative cysteine protease